MHGPLNVKFLTLYATGKHKYLNMVYRFLLSPVNFPSASQCDRVIVFLCLRCKGISRMHNARMWVFLLSYLLMRKVKWKLYIHIYIKGNMCDTGRAFFRDE